MRFTKHVRGANVVNEQGEQVGVIKDLVANFDTVFPRLTHLVVEMNKMEKIADHELVEPVEKVKILIPWEQVGSFKDHEDKTITLKVEPEKINLRNLKDDEQLVGEYILDQQILNNEGLGMRRVTDVVVVEHDDNLVLAGLSVGVVGILEQLGLEKSILVLDDLIHPEEIEKDIIPWNYVDELRPRKKQIKLHKKTSKDSVVKVVIDKEDEEAEKIIHKKKPGKKTKIEGKAKR